MDKILMKKFALTYQGARGMKKSAIIEFLFNMVNMLPMILLMAYMDMLLMDSTMDKRFIILLSLITLILMLIIFPADYNALYNAVYKESEDTRVELAKRLRELPLSYFSRHDLSDISQTIMADVEALEHAMGHAISKTAGLFLFLPIISIMLIMGNLKLGLTVVIPMFLSLLLIILSKKIQLKGNEKHYKVLRMNSEAFQENIELSREIRNYGLVDSEKAKIDHMIEYAERIHLKIEIPIVITLLISGLLVYLSIAIVILMASKMYIQGEISLLYVTGYIIAAAKIKDALESAGAFLSEIFYLDARIARIREIKEYQVQTGSDTEIDGYDIQFENVSFSYDKDTPVLSNLNLLAKSGTVTALVGKSGCGKTSILRLVSRLYDYDDGVISIGGKDIKKIDPEFLFKNISIVFQDVTLFGGNFMENIRLGNKDASDEEVINAAKMAGCHEFISKCEKGYLEEIGENGNLLSGGERQRISIARAFLKDAPIVILDEIMASLDVENEMAIQESLIKLIKNKTVIIISHRMRSIENVDAIALIDNGRLESFGSHAELMKTSKVYKSLIEKSVLAENFRY